MTYSSKGSVHEKEKAYLVEIIANVNDLFEGELTDDDRLIYVKTSSRASYWNRRS